MNFNIRNCFSYIRKWTSVIIKRIYFLILKIRILMWENNFFNIRKSSKFIFNIKNSFSNIKKINDINFINIKFAVLEISSVSN